VSLSDRLRNPIAGVRDDALHKANVVIVHQEAPFIHTELVGIVYESGAYAPVMMTLL
jgi:hypothetical protein